MTSVAQAQHLQNPINPAEIYSDSRTHGYKGTSRYVRFPRVTSAGGGCITKSEDGVRCAVAGKESLRILRISDGNSPNNTEGRSIVGKGGWKIDATRNLWEGCGLKIESATTGIAWGRGPFNHKLFTSARNGELIMWDISRAGTARIERRTKDHTRSINQLSISHSVHHYCVTGSADGDLRIWDLRDMSKSLMRVYHPTSVRSVAFSPNIFQPLQAIVGLDNGSIYRWDLKMGQRGLLDRLLVAHTTPVTSLSWCNPCGTNGSQTSDNGLGWFASGALDRTVKVWDLTAPGSISHIPSKPTYILHPRYPVRRILWRPGYDCEIAVISNPDVSHMSSVGPSFLSRTSNASGTDTPTQSSENEMPNASHVESSRGSALTSSAADDAIEIWDVRRGWIAKWSVRRSGAEGSLTDVEFADSHAMWTLHHSGGFFQLDLRDATKPIDAVPRVALTWSASDSVTFTSDQRRQFEVPYDDIRTDDKPLAEQLGVHIKALGDSMAQPQAQNIGTLLFPSAALDVESFRKLAQNYTLIGESRTSICCKNAQAAREVGKEDIAQVWYLLAACLEEIVPQNPLPLQFTSQVTSPQGMTTHSLIPTPASARYSQSYFPQPQKISPGRKSTNSMESPQNNQQPQKSSSRHLTPASSASSSPRHNNHNHLPPITPRRPSIFSRNSTVDPSSSRRPSIYRRPSISSSMVLGSGTPLGEKDEDANKPSLRRVGDGALSSDSSGNDSDIGSAGTAGVSSDEETNVNTSVRPPMTSPTSFLFQRSITAPSPLSRVASRRRRWTTEEETGGNDNDNSDNHHHQDYDNDGGSSASPHSSDLDSDDMPRSSSVSRRRQSSGRKASSNRYKSRSRSSTVASLAAPPPPSPPVPSFLPLLAPDTAAADGGVPGLVRQSSVSSVRTVVAGQHPDMEENLLSLRTEGTVRELGINSSSRLALDTVMADNAPGGVDSQQEEKMTMEAFTERRIGIVQADEKRIKSGCLQIIKRAVEMFADSGEVQMCAFIVILARSELGVGIKRAVAFVEAYLDKLDRMGLYVCSAYIRKHCQMKDIQEVTSTHTSISTSCGRCHKPLLKPSGRNADGTIAKGGYSYCLTCRKFVPCAIWQVRLPVRTLYYQCPVCRHGAHEKCYQGYSEENRYICPSGCGHRCFE